ncbi:MAG: amino acid adenylation domain-containing protein, partial [Chitinophagaceae bacterium]
VKNVTYLSSSELDKIINQFNDTAVDYPGQKTIVDLFTEHVNKQPDHAALVSDGRIVTYRDLEEQSNQLAGYLRRKNVKKDDLVVVCMDRSIEMIISILAVLKAGATYVPVDPAYKQERISFILSDTAASVIISHSYYQELLEGYSNIILLDRDRVLIDQEPVQQVDVSITSHTPAYVIYTSGSTGQPKGVIIEHTAIVNLISWHIKRYDVSSSSRSTTMAGVGFDACALEIFSALLSGSTLYIINDEVKLQPEQLLAFYSTHQVTHAFVPPVLIPPVVNATQPDELSLRYVLIGGDRLPAIETNKINYTLVNQYGPTECAVMVSDYPLDRNYIMNGLPPIGKPIANVQLYIMDSSLQVQPIGVTGELLIGGVQLARGYLNNYDLTNEKFIAHPFKKDERLYRTGDLARWLADGNIEYIGRLDDQVKIRGYRIEPGEIEHIIQQIDEVESALVTVYTEESDQKALVAYFVSSEEAFTHRVRQHLNEKLPDYMVPAYFVQLESFPLTVHGKIDRNALPDPLSIDNFTTTEYVAPRTVIEQVLAEVYKDVLNQQQVSVKDNFFDLGGDSIKAILLINRLKQKGYTVKVGDVLKYPVMEELSRQVKSTVVQTVQNIVQGEVVLTPVQRWFLENSGPNKHHYNQSVLLHSKERIDITKLESSLRALTTHHDALRMVYYQQDGEWKQYNRDADKYSYHLEVHELRQREKREEDKIVEELCGQLQASIDLQKGPLLKAALFHREDGDRLLIVVHHLVVDGVSWRILLEDLTIAYSQLQKGEAIQLPLKSDSFQAWADNLHTYANNTTIVKELSYWLLRDRTIEEGLPVDFPDGSNKLADSTSVTITLSDELTDLLQTKVNRVYNTEINDILLSVLGLAIEDAFGRSEFLVELEGHGREEIADEMNISRTVGWFTSVYPVRLEKQSTDNATGYLVRVKEQLRKVPGKGIGYGLLKYMRKSGSEATVPEVRPDITFNYLGDFGSGIKSNTGEELFDFTSENRGMEINGDHTSGSLLTVTGMIASSSLQVSFTYNNKQYRKETIEILSERYHERLVELLQLLAGETNTYVTPGDLTYKELSIAEVQGMSKNGAIEDVYELSPLQEGIYFHWLSEPGTTAYIEQISYRVQGSLNMEVLRQSYEYLIARHGVLRTSFTHEYGSKNLQVVKKNVRSDFRYQPMDNQEDKELFIAKYKQQDRATGFDLNNGSQMRLTVLDLGNEEYEFIWTHHHILMDGWCISILINEFYAIYRNLINRQQPVLTKQYPYSNYIQWLMQNDKTAGIAYWKNYLDGYESLSPVPFKERSKIGAYYFLKEESLVLDNVLTGTIKKICKDLNITESTFVQTVWGYLISYYNDTDDVVFGSVVSGRPGGLEGIEGMVGLFINTIPVRVKYDNNMRVKDLLQNVQKEAIEGLTAHYSQLSEIQSGTALRNKLFDHIVIYENFPIQSVISENFEEKESNNNQQQGLESLRWISSEAVEQTNYDF